MAIQPDPPIQLDPSQDTGHQLAFINQNFQSLANYLRANTLQIVAQKATPTINVPAITQSAVGVYIGGSSPSATIPHGLPFTPIVIASEGDTTAFSPLSQPFGGSTGSAMEYQDYLVLESDATNIYFFVNRTMRIFTAGSVTAPSINYKAYYYLLQQTNPTS